MSMRKRSEEALKKSEERLEAFLCNSSAVMFVKDTEGRYLEVNPEFERAFRLPCAQVLGRTDAEIFPQEQAAAFRANDLKVLQEDRPLEFEEVALYGDGLHISIVAKFPLRDANGRTYAIGGVATDITKRKHLEEQLRQSQKMEAVGRLAGGIAHDFNNMLTVINGYSQLLLSRLGPDAPYRAEIEEINTAGTRAEALTRQLLAFSRKQVLQPSVLELNAVVTNLERMLQRVIGENIELRAVLHPQLDRVLADPEQIEQVIMNLATNARDAMPQGGTLTIETANVELNETYTHRLLTITTGPHVLLAVSNTGCGMTKETQARIFEPFFTTKKQSKGTGLGLSTVYAIVRQSGGSIWVYSEPGHGATFKIYLPRVEKTGEAVAPAEAREEREVLDGK